MSMKIKNFNRFTRYAGSKLHFIEKFNDITASLDQKIYVEPFFGSGAIFFNLDKEYDKYIINDINPHVINAVKSFRDGTYKFYKEILEDVNVKFGDIKTNKEAYYNFRNSFNKEFFDKNKDVIKEGFMFHMLMNSCINSLVRIGPNGFNQSYGNCLYVLDEKTFTEVNRRLNMNVEITSMDYSELIKQNDSENTLYFLDPPYLARNSVGYIKTYDAKSDLTDFICILKQLKGKVIYTDIECDIHATLEWDSHKTKMLSSISPLRRGQESNQEVFFANFNAIETKREITLELF